MSKTELLRLITEIDIDEVVNFDMTIKHNITISKLTYGSNFMEKENGEEHLKYD